MHTHQHNTIVKLIQIPCHSISIVAMMVTIIKLRN